jgi:hypothetical protein
MNKLIYERDEYLAHLLGYETKIIGQKTYILVKGNIFKWTGFQTNNDLGKMKLLHLMCKREDAKKFFSNFDVFDLIFLLENKDGRFRDEAIKFLDAKL